MIIDIFGKFGIGSGKFVYNPNRKLRQDFASAVNIIFDTRDENIIPFWYIGYQIVNGTNCALVCKRIRTQDDLTVTDFVVVVINVPPGVDGYKKATLIKQEDADNAIFTTDAKNVFDSAIKNLVGAIHKPLVELGTEKTSNGVNYHFLCQSLTVYPNAIPYLSRVVISKVQDHISMELFEVV